ncbi:aminotransferase class III-fold pyridoxal phosphate-dependent enzyme [Maridesulfovibrio zosterae]|uniref:aminotransferase class III-fold pyridoxal phosphate-dependent enzyme n=1 Tax=Maridesulfovibrio zosterae TaxID=82171 RepID=UPI000413D0E6|nr:aminotransferase class III-fold pyridoxal phosphate-dependent enzyme [Maridesulfovibrio zosterae]
MTDEERYKEAKENDRKYMMHSWSVQEKLSPVLVTGCEGIYYWDETGKKYMDFGSQLVNLNIGHNHPKVQQAIKDQVDDICFIGPQFANETRGKLAKKIIELLPDNFGKCFFTIGGADANENAIKMARAFTGKTKIFSRYRSYHGATYGAISLSGDPRRPPVEPGIPGVVRFFDPYCYRCPFGHKYPDCKMECATHLEEIIGYENKDTCAAVLVESITGTNGVFVPPAGYMEKLREICDRNDMLLICDEVMTGFGRTGKMFGFENFDIKPDIITMAKGVNSGYVPLGVACVSQEIADWYESNMLWCGLTYSGHPVSCAAALATIEAYEEEKIVENSAALGEVLKEELLAMKEKHPSIGDVRVKGLFACIETVKDRETREPLVPWNGAPGVMGEVAAKMKELGVTMFVRWNFIFITPPLVITKEELLKGLSCISEALKIADAALEK